MHAFVLHDTARREKQSKKMGGIMEVSFARFDLCLDKGECAPCPESFFDAFASGGLLFASLGKRA